MKEQKTYRADLHYHGPIGFEPYWLRVQGYKGKNLLQLIVDACFKRKIDICALTSETDQYDKVSGIITRNSIHDRIGYLIENCVSDLDKVRGYKADRFGLNSIVVEKNEKKTFLISGQTPIVLQPTVDRQNKRIDYLIFGSNAVPNGRNLVDTQKFCKDHGLSHGLEHPAVEAHFGIGLEEAKKYIGEAEFVEGHNSQIRLPRFMASVPKFGDYSKIKNEEAKEFARVYGKPYIATSDGHMIESAGRSYIEFDSKLVKDKDEENLLSSVRTAIKNNAFSTHERYENIIDLCEWVIKFKWGVRGEKYKGK